VEAGWQILLKSALGGRARGGDAWAALKVTRAIHMADPKTAALLP
jgi:hypothetical protein